MHMRERERETERQRDRDRETETERYRHFQNNFIMALKKFRHILKNNDYVQVLFGSKIRPHQNMVMPD